jgi:pilus assembly protein TadC
MNLLEFFGRLFFPQRWREPIRQYLLKAGYDTVPYHLFGIMFFVAVGLTYIAFIGFFVGQLKDYSPAVQGLASMIFWIVVLFSIIALVALGAYFVLNLKIYGRVREMESALPDYLQLVVTNLKSGMNFEQSLWSAAKPEFGILAKEITLVSKKVLTGNDTADAIRDFVDRYDSPTLRRNFNLVISEIQSGGHIASVIERVITSLKKTKDLKDEMAASVLNFMIFIAVIVIVLAPVLFALANTLLDIMLGFAKLLSGNLGSASGAIGNAAGLVEKMGKFAADGERIKATFQTFSYWAVGLIAFCSSLIVSIIEKGDLRGGIRYVPLFTVAALAVFTIALKILTSMFGGLVLG